MKDYSNETYTSVSFRISQENRMIFPLKEIFRRRLFRFQIVLDTRFKKQSSTNYSEIEGPTEVRKNLKLLQMADGFSNEIPDISSSPIL